MNDDNTIQKTQAERYGRFMADTVAHGPPIATGTSRRFLAEKAAEFTEKAAEFTETAVRFKDGSEIQRADGSLPSVEPKPARAPRQQIEMD